MSDRILPAFIRENKQTWLDLSGKTLVDKCSLIEIFINFLSIRFLTLFVGLIVGKVRAYKGVDFAQSRLLVFAVLNGHHN